MTSPEIRAFFDEPTNTFSYLVWDPVSREGGVVDPVLDGHVVTVPKVKMSPDLKLATIYVMPLGGKDGDEVIAALERNKKYMRGEIAHRINLKFAPELRFRIDDSFDNTARIDALLHSPKVAQDLKQADAPEDEEQ